MKHKIQLKDWEHTCGDGCCFDYGTDLYIDGERITQYADSHNMLIESLLNHFKIEHELEIE